MVAYITQFEPINQVTPFTYRDNETYLSTLRGLRHKINELIAHVDAADAELIVQFNQALQSLDAEISATIAAMREEFIDLIDDDAGVGFDPTTGSITTPIFKALNNVYDNTRIYAYFAVELDTLGFTAAEWDLMAYGARHFDLAMTYPDIHDSLT